MKDDAYYKWKFRLALLDDYDKCISVEWESDIIEAKDKWDRNISDTVYQALLEANKKYNFVDYDNVPAMEFQYMKTDSKGKWSDWSFWSDPIVDYYNL